METAYAQALWQMVTDGGMSPSEAVRALRESLEKHGRIALLPRVARAFARIAEREMRKDGITLTVAREKDAHKAHTAIREVLEKIGATDKEVAVRVDESIIGGWRLEGRGELVDASYKKMLLDIYNRTASGVSGRKA